MADFDDTLHQLLNVPRPKPGNEQEQELKNLVRILIALCNEDSGSGTIDKETFTNRRWERFVLSLLYKRYHLLSPEAKNLVKEDSTTAITAGDGERLIFYTAVQVLFEQATACGDLNDEQHVNNQHNTIKALSVLCQLAPCAGGSRDVCKLIEQFVTHVLQHEKQVPIFPEKLSESIEIAKALYLVECKLQEVRSVSDQIAYSSLSWLIDFAADQLSRDLDLVQEETKGSTPVDSDNEKDHPLDVAPLTSTMHVFVPHNKRGLTSKKKRRTSSRNRTATESTPSLSLRRIANSVSEILIWSRTPAAMQNGAFAKALRIFRDSNKESINKEAVKSSLMTIQTIVRKLRQKLNNHARDKGYMLSDLFVLDPSSVQLRKLLKAKSGDLSKLTRLAKKKRSTDILLMVQGRFASSPNKITKYSSIGEFVRSWSTTIDSSTADSEVLQLERTIQKQRLGATIEYLRSVFAGIRPKGDGHADSHPLVIASLDRAFSTICNINHITAAFVAAAMAKWPIQEEVDITLDDADARNETYTIVKLILGKTTQVIDSFQNFETLMDGIVSQSLKIEFDDESFVGGEDAAPGVATFKAVMNVIDRHVIGGHCYAPQADLLLFTAASIRIPAQVQESFTDAGCRIHCHDIDDIGKRLHREKARKGDITISLAWDTRDDLDLHVFLPTGEEIYYGNKVSDDENACLDVDMNVSGGSEEPVENVYLGDAERRIEADHGVYKVIVRNYSYHTDDHNAAIPWRVVVDKNGEKERFHGTCTGAGAESTKQVCEFVYNGRTVPFSSEEKESFGTSNLVSISTSTGQTLESVSQLLQVMNQLQQLDEVRALAADYADGNLMVDGDNVCESNQRPEASAVAADDADGDLMADGDNVGESNQRPVQAASGVLEVTSRDRLDVLLAGLPKHFQAVVAQAFGGGTSLADECAQVLSQKLVAEKIPLSALKAAGYPAEVVDAVKSRLLSATTMTN